MITKAFTKLLQQSFSKIGLKLSKGGDLSINEFRIIEPTNYIPSTNYLHFTITVEAQFQAGDFQRKVLEDSSFLNSLKQNFVVKTVDNTREEKNRTKATFTLLQVNGIC